MLSALAIMLYVTHLWRNEVVIVLVPVPTPPHVPTPPSMPTPPSTNRSLRVLVLGSGGLVGRGLVAALRERGHAILEIKGRADHDLRRPHAAESIRDADFCFFLACEVGGARYLSSHVDDVERHNEQMYHVVFAALERQHIPFIFASSQLALTNTSYGRVKRHGEDWAARIGGKSVRFWNVYGPEAVGSRSHVLSDWTHACLTEGRAASLTTGDERRYFTYTDDVGRALVLLMEHFPEMRPVEDVTRLESVSLKEAAAALAPCVVNMGKEVARHATSAPPQLSALLLAHWRPHVDLKEGMARVRAHLAHVVGNYSRACREAPLISLVFASRGDAYGLDQRRDSIWHRTLNSLRHWVHQARAVYLPFEIVVGEYNYRQGRDTPMAAMPWPKGALYRIRTVPHAVHLERGGSPDAFWEYLGKNVAARAARGQYVILFNPDNLVQPELIALLARNTLHPRNIYRARREDHPRPVWELTGMSLGELAATLPSAPVIREGAHSPKGRFWDASGDFTMLARDRFIEVPCGRLACVFSSLSLSLSLTQHTVRSAATQKCTGTCTWTASA